MQIKTHPAPVVIIGIGEMAGVFARGFLRAGYPIYPVTRDMDLQALAEDIPNPSLVLVAVGEGDLQGVLKTLPKAWHPYVALLQNELLPQDWQQHGLDDATVISVWFEKKAGQDFKVIVPSPAFGKGAQLLAESLGSIGIPVAVLDNEQDLLFELVRKNLYILTSNIAGLQVGGTVGSLWHEHSELARAITDDIYQIQSQLCGESLDLEALTNAMVAAFEGDMAHKCMGRSAPARLKRALEQADKFGLDVPNLRHVQQASS